MLKWIPILVSTSVLTTACSREVQIVGAEAIRINERHVLISATVARSDAAFIRDREIYAGFVILECSDTGDRFPFDAMINGIRSPNYALPEGEYVSFTGSIPTRIFDEFDSPCLTIEGGSYTGMSISAKAIRLKPG